VSFRRALRRWLANDKPDLIPSDCVVAVWGRPVGWIYDITGDCARVWWHTAGHGRYEVIQLNLLRRGSADPASGLDVRRR